MPIQVLKRYDPDQENPFRGMSESIAETVRQKEQQKATWEIAKLQAVMNAKNAQTEADKIKGQKVKEFLDYSQKVTELGVDQETKMKLLSETAKTLGLDPVEELSNLGQLIAGLPMSAKAQKDKAESAFMSRASQMLESQFPQGGPSVPGTGGEGVSPDSRMRALGGEGPVMSSFDVNTPIGSMKFEVPEVQRRLTREKLTTELETRRDMELEPMRESIGDYLTTFDNAVEEMGGLGKNALEASAKGHFAEFAAKFGDKPNIQALELKARALAIQIGSYLNRGKPTEADAIAAAKVLLRLTLSENTNKILRSYINTIAGGKDFIWDSAMGKWVSPSADKLYNSFKTGKFNPSDVYTTPQGITYVKGSDGLYHKSR